MVESVKSFYNGLTGRVEVWLDYEPKECVNLRGVPYTEKYWYVVDCEAKGHCDSHLTFESALKDYEGRVAEFIKRAEGAKSASLHGYA